MCACGGERGERRVNAPNGQGDSGESGGVEHCDAVCGEEQDALKRVQGLEEHTHKRVEKERTLLCV